MRNSINKNEFEKSFGYNTFIKFYCLKLKTIIIIIIFFFNKKPIPEYKVVH